MPYARSVRPRLIQGVAAANMGSRRASNMSPDLEIASASEATIRCDYEHGHFRRNPFSNAEELKKAMTSSSSKEEMVVAAPSSSWAVRDWLVVLGGFMATTATGGAINSIGLLQTQWEHIQLRAYTPRDVGWIAGVSICLTLFLPVVSGPVFDRRGHQWLMIPGCTLFVAGLFLMSFLDEKAASAPGVTFGALLLSWGVLCGTGNGLVSTAVTGLLCRRFDRRRGFACGLSSMGSSVGGVVWPLLLRDTLQHWGWGWAVRLLAGASLGLLSVGSVLVSGYTAHRRPSCTPSSSPSGDDEPDCEDDEKRLVSTFKGCVTEGAKCFFKSEFVWMTASLAIFQFIVMGLVGTLPSWGKLQGFDAVLLFNVVAVMNSGSCAGRVAIGALAHWIGSFNSALITMFCYVIVIFGIMLNIGQCAWQLYTFAALWGFFYGALLSMMSVLIRELSGQASFGRYLSASYSVISVGGFLCVPLSAQMLASFGPYIHVIFFGALCALSFVFMMMSRWAILSWKWK